MSTSSTFPARRDCKVGRSSWIRPTMSLNGLAWTTSPTTCERRGLPASNRGRSVPPGGVALARSEEEEGDASGACEHGQGLLHDPSLSEEVLPEATRPFEIIRDRPSCQEPGRLR